MTRDLTIANACEAARNPFASPHTNQAVGNLIAFLVEMATPGFQVDASASDNNYARRWLELKAQLNDEIDFNVARDADIKASRTIYSDALHDSDLPGDLTNAGERVLEAAE